MTTHQLLDENLPLVFFVDGELHEAAGFTVELEYYRVDGELKFGKVVRIW